jgi:hypothetical protein
LKFSNGETFEQGFGARAFVPAIHGRSRFERETNGKRQTLLRFPKTCGQLVQKSLRFGNGTSDHIAFRKLSLAEQPVQQ